MLQSASMVMIGNSRYNCTSLHGSCTNNMNMNSFLKNHNYSFGFMKWLISQMGLLIMFRGVDPKSKIANI